jgi:hypothetical protein
MGWLAMGWLAMGWTPVGSRPPRARRSYDLSHQEGSEYALNNSFALVHPARRGRIVSTMPRFRITHSANPPADDPDAGVEGNARLTSATGLVLLVMLAVEGYTILDVRGMITLHVFLGVMLLGPVLLKVGSTLYRFTRYYAGDETYLRRGPPHVLLRVIGPLVTVSTLALLGTGVALLEVRPGEGLLLTAHKASFIVWFGLMTVHILGHLREAAISSWHEVCQSSQLQRIRLGVLVVAVLAGVGTAAALMPTASLWTHRSPTVGEPRH